MPLICSFTQHEDLMFLSKSNIRQCWGLKNKVKILTKELAILQRRKVNKSTIMIKYDNNNEKGNCSVSCGLNNQSVFLFNNKITFGQGNTLTLYSIVLSEYLTQCGIVISSFDSGFRWSRLPNSVLLTRCGRTSSFVHVKLFIPKYL